MTCRHCGTDIAEKALICYRCGRPTAEPRVKPPADESIFEGRRRSGRSRWVAVAVVLAAALAAVVWWLLVR